MKRLTALIVILAILIPVMVQAQVISTVEREYIWYAEEKLTVSNTVKQLSSEEYNYDYAPTSIAVEDPNAVSFVVGEVITDETTGAMGIVMGADDLTSASRLDIDILYNGGDSADIDPNDVLTAASGASATCTATMSYTRGDADGYGSTQYINPQIAEIHILDNSLLYTINNSTPVYSATDASAFGEKQYEGDTFYIFGSNAIVNFKAIRNGTSDAVIYVRYGY